MSDYDNIMKLKLHGIILIHNGAMGAVFVMIVLGGLVYSWDSQTIFVPTIKFDKPDSSF